MTPTTPANPTPAGACITQVRSGDHNVAVQNPLGALGATPAFSPKLQYNLRARYDWSFNDYKAFAQVGMTHVDDMDNQPSSFPSGNGIAVPTTTWLRYTMPGYETYDASLGISKGSVGRVVLRPEPREHDHEHLHDVGPGHPGAGAAASAGAGPEGGLQVLIGDSTVNAVAVQSKGGQ